jgi:hypothetical protein
MYKTMNSRSEDAKTVTLTDMPALAPAESCRSVGRRASGVSVGIGGSPVGEDEEVEDADGLKDEGLGAGTAVGFEASSEGGAVEVDEFGIPLLEDELMVVLEELDGLAEPPVVVLAAGLELELFSSPPSPGSAPAASHAPFTCSVAFFRSSSSHSLFKQLAASDNTVPPAQWHAKSVSLLHPSFVKPFMKHVNAHLGRARDANIDCLDSMDRDRCGIDAAEGIDVRKQAVKSRRLDAGLEMCMVVGLVERLYGELE